MLGLLVERFKSEHFVITAPTEVSVSAMPSKFGKLATHKSNKQNKEVNTDVKKINRWKLIDMPFSITSSCRYSYGKFKSARPKNFIMS